MLLRDTLRSVLASPGAPEAAGDEVRRLFRPAWPKGLASHALVLTGVRRSGKSTLMFTLSDMQSRARARASILLLNAGLAGSFITVLMRSPWKLLFAAVVISGLVFYGWEMRSILGARKRRTLDWGLKYFLTAISLLGALSILAVVL